MSKYFLQCNVSSLAERRQTCCHVTEADSHKRQVGRRKIWSIQYTACNLYSHRKTNHLHTVLLMRLKSEAVFCLGLVKKKKKTTLSRFRFLRVCVVDCMRDQTNISTHSTL